VSPIMRRGVGRTTANGLSRGAQTGSGIPTGVTRRQEGVALIEPDAAIAHLCALVLGEGGYAVACADEALALLATRGHAAFRAVLSYDFVRSRAVPYAWLDYLRTRTDAPIMIYTRDPAATYADHRARGYDAVIEEPYDLDALLAVVTALCPRDGDRGESRLEYLYMI